MSVEKTKWDIDIMPMYIDIYVDTRVDIGWPVFECQLVVLALNYNVVFVTLSIVLLNSCC